MLCCCIATIGFTMICYLLHGTDDPILSMMCIQGRLNGREQRVASREQMMARQDAESAGQVAEAQAAAASAYRNARQDLDQEYKAQREVLDRERRALEADR